jgi:inorganic triphosphatase YgiF
MVLLLKKGDMKIFLKSKEATIKSFGTHKMNKIKEKCLSLKMLRRLKRHWKKLMELGKVKRRHEYQDNYSNYSRNCSNYNYLN